MKLTSRTPGAAATVLALTLVAGSGIATPAHATVGPNNSKPVACQSLYEQAYENSYDTLDMLGKLGEAELCFADQNDQRIANTQVQLDDFRDRFGALCSLLADAAHVDNHSLIRIYNLQCRVEAERGLTSLIEAYLNGRKTARTVAIWDGNKDDQRLDRMQAITSLHENLIEARHTVVEHFIASIRATFPDRNETEVKSRVENTLAGVQRPDDICEDLKELTPEGGVCTSDVAALTSGLIYRYYAD